MARSTSTNPARAISQNIKKQIVNAWVTLAYSAEKMME
jgi:hypothetical protein